MTKTAGVVIMIMFILFPKEIKEGALLGINNGIFILLPSIFPYIAVSDIFLKSGGADFVSDITYKFLKPLFRFDKSFSGAYLISLFCGYPTGAKMASQLSEYGKKQALRLFYFGNMAGFGFCVSFLGGIWGNVNTGLKIYFSFLLTSLILNYISSFFLSDKEITIPKNKSYLSLSVSITQAVKDSSLSMISIMGYAVFFSSMCEIFNSFIGNEVFSGCISGFLEITAGIPALIKKVGLNVPLIVFFTGFSGLSVIFQSLSFKKVNISILILTRIIFALLSCLIFIILN